MLVPSRSSLRSPLTEMSSGRPARAPDRVRYALIFCSRRPADGRPALLTLDDELLTKIGASLAPEIDDETPSYGCLGVNRRLRELWRPFVCSRLRLLSARPAATWLLPEALRFVSISDAVQHIEAAFSSTGFPREIAAVSIFRNLRSLSIDFQREQATMAPPDGFTAQLKKLFAHLPALEDVTLIEPTLVVFDIASLFATQNTQLRSLRLQIRQRTMGRITTVPLVKLLDLDIGGSRDDIPAGLPFTTLDALTVDSDAMEEAALKEVDDQLTEAARVRQAAPRVPGQKS